jgi:apolipoprotein N-acyltransferase
MKELLIKLQSAFDTHSKGFSARKLTAFAIVLCVFVAHIAWIKSAFIKEDFSLLEGILIIDYSFIGGLLGLTTYESLKKQGNGNSDEPKQ